jgi:hypothetical protein
MNPALAAHAEHHHTIAVASFDAQRAADRQAKLDALLLEAIAALAGLFSGPDHPGSRPA